MHLRNIQSKIYELRGVRVMLDFDLAELYQTATKRLKEAVRRHIKRFPSDFMFELTKEEFEEIKPQINLRTHIATSKRGGLRYMPFAFTEHGVTMLASILNSDKAIDMNIAIVRAFIGLKQLSIELKDFMQQLKILREELHYRIDMHDAQLNQIYEAIENMLDDQCNQKAKQLDWANRERIGFKKG